MSNRGNFDLIQHSKMSKRKLQCNESNSTELIIPNVIETSIGIERIMVLKYYHIIYLLIDEYNVWEYYYYW